jgi:ribulose 1,5-bisphosphate synthetase/thiazole synthase
MDKRTFLKTTGLFGAGALITKGGIIRGNQVIFQDNPSQADASPGQEMQLREGARDIPVYDNVDVLVCGGGLGGVAAAIAASRAGARTLLVERNTCLGGTATSGMCCSIFNCFYTGGSERRLTTHGIALEIADAFAESLEYGQKWRQHKGHIIYDLEKAKLILQQLVEQANATILLGTWNAGVIMEGQRLGGVIVENKSGRGAILAKVVVDATGDADIAAFAGAPVKVFETGLNSLCFRFGNVDVDEFIEYFKENPAEYPEYMDVDWNFQEVMAQYRDCGTFLFPHGGGVQMEAFKLAKASGTLPMSVGIQDTTDAAQMHAIRKTNIVHVITGFTHVCGTNASDICKSILDGREMVFRVAEAYRKYIPGFENAFVAGVGDNLGVRWTRRITGISRLDGMKAGSRVADAVGRTVGWDNIIKHPGKNAWGVQICHSDGFDIPRSCLLPEQIEGLIMGAGRSANTKGPGDLRVMAHTMVVGQGAGVTAAISSKTDSTPRNVSIAMVQDELKRQGAL